MPKKPTTYKKYASGGPVTKHQTLATGGTPAGDGRSDQGYKKGGKVAPRGRRGC